MLSYLVGASSPIAFARWWTSSLGALLNSSHQKRNPEEGDILAEISAAGVEQSSGVSQVGQAVPAGRGAQACEATDLRASSRQRANSKPVQARAHFVPTALALLLGCSLVSGRLLPD